MRFGLTARIFAISASILLALWIALITVFYVTNDLSRTATRLSPEQLAAITELLTTLPAEARPRALAALQSSMLELQIVPAEALPAEDGEPVDEKEMTAYRQMLGTRLQEIRLMHQERGLPRPRQIFPTARPIEFRIALDDGQILVAEARTPFFVTLFGLPAGMAPGLIGTLFACLAFFLLHREINPLTRLAAALDRVDPSGEPISLPPLRSTTPETRALARAFDRLQMRLQAMTRSRMALIGGIQHDVRSFATRLRLRLEQLPDDSERERATADIDDMIGLLDNALLASKAGIGALNEELLDLSELLRAEIADFAGAGLPVTLEMVETGTEISVIADRVALRRVIANVIDNALCYGHRARVGLAVTRTEATISIADDGPGFSQENKDVLLEPFVRAEPSRARSTGGAGLGLAVARTLIEAQGGSIALENGARGGVVRLSLPLYAAR